MKGELHPTKNRRGALLTSGERKIQWAPLTLRNPPYSRRLWSPNEICVACLVGQETFGAITPQRDACLSFTLNSSNSAQKPISHGVLHTSFANRAHGHYRHVASIQPETPLPPLISFCRPLQSRVLQIRCVADTYISPPIWSVKIRRAPSRYCRDARVYSHTITAVHDNEHTHTPPIIIDGQRLLSAKSPALRQSA
ncbi:unnamed protein product [Laminaria digitata]